MIEESESKVLHPGVLVLTLVLLFLFTWSIRELSYSGYEKSEESYCNGFAGGQVIAFNQVEAQLKENGHSEELIRKALGIMTFAPCDTGLMTRIGTKEAHCEGLVHGLISVAEQIGIESSEVEKENAVDKFVADCVKEKSGVGADNSSNTAEISGAFTKFNL